MADYSKMMQGNQDVPLDLQKRVGESSAAKMGGKHEAFLNTILALLDAKSIDLKNPESLLKTEAYGALSEGDQGKVDLALFNIANLLTRIVEFRLSKHTPDESPELESMIEHLLQMKERLGELNNVFKF